MRMTDDERRARLVARQLLAPATRARDPVDVARALVALHSTDPVTVYLSTWARTAGPTPSTVDEALYDARSLVRVHAMRRTLWVVPRELVPIVYAACTRTIAGRERRRLESWIVKSGISSRPGAWLTRAGNAALKELEARGEASTSDLVAAVPALGKRLHLGVGSRWQTTQSVGARILPQLAMEGRIVRGRPRGTWVNGQYRWIPTTAWLGERIADVEVTEAQAVLVRRWLTAFGPGTEADLRWWTGWTAREVRGALAAVPHAEVEVSGAVGYVLADDLGRAERSAPSAALLPTLDPTTMGWKERDWYLGPHASVLFDANGNAGPTVWWEGRVVGGWTQRRDGEIRCRMLEDVGSEAIAAIEREALRLEAWLGDVRFSPSFLPPFHRSLAA